MNEDEQEIWAALGWDADSWEEETAPPSSNDEYWEDLTDAERDAATTLGYSQAYWDEEY
jgi:hypothetical protein